MEKLKNIENVVNEYSITVDGLVYSHIKQRWLKGQINNCGYLMYHLKLIDGKFKWFMAARLVAYTFIGCPEGKKEINHIDSNRQNNHVDNLEWVTHSFNNPNRVRCSYWLGKQKMPHSVETKLLMSNAKKKKVEVFRFDKAFGVFESVEDCIKALSVTRRTFNRILKNENHKLAKQFTFNFIHE